MWKRRLIPVVLGLLVLVGLALVRVADPYPVAMARATAFDFFQQLAPRPRTDAPVRVIDIDDASLKAIGQWPWPRDVLATLTARLGELGAAAIGYDVLFSEPDRLSPSRLAAALPAGTAAKLADYDTEFAAALAKTPSILGFSISTTATALPRAPKGGFAISGTDPTAAIPAIPGAVLPLETLGAAAPGLGALSLDASESVSTIRSLPLLWASGGALYPTLVLEALRLASGQSTMVVFGDSFGHGYVESVRVGDFTIPTTASGNLTLYYSPPDPALYVSAREVLGPDYRALKPRIAGQIVLVGSSASGLLDLHATPLGTNVPGVSIHAQALQQILAGAYLTRSDWVSGLELISFALTGLIIIATVLRVGPLAGLAIGATLLGLIVASSWLLYRRYGLLLDPSFPLVGSFVLYAAMVFLRFVLTDADRRQIRRAFGHYVAPALLSRIERSGAQLQLGGEVRELTVMFADMRNFTSVSEAMAPAELLGLLNTLFGALGAEVVAHDGTIDKFIGDALMAFWNAPVDVPDHPRKACRAALGMRRRLRALNAADAFERRAAGAEPAEIAVGIGISTGEALVGNMGLESRFDYSCLGDTVNTAARIEAASKSVGYDIVSGGVAAAAVADFAWLEAGALWLKGKAVRSPIHILVGDADLAGSEAFVRLKAAHLGAIAALRADAGAAPAIARCRALVAEVDPALAGFYDRLEARAMDFREW